MIVFKTKQAFEHFLNQRDQLGIKPGLERMEILLDAVNHPEQKLKAIHVAGTNGKGSTVTYLASVLICSGYNVGTFMSPSLTNRQGMISINHAYISDKDYLKYANRLATVIEQLDCHGNPASNFEILVAIAYQYFADSTDVVLVEAGMGGRMDATNCLIPVVSIITSIDYDHTYFLGDQLESIAYHKAGIIKPGCPVVVGALPEEAMRVINSEALNQAAKCYSLHEDFQVKQNHDNVFLFETKDSQDRLAFQLALAGKHQVENAALAVQTLFLLKNQGFVITDQQIQTGLVKATLAARFETIHTNPTIILDGAHNVAGIKAFVQTAESQFANDRKQLLFAAFKDKPLTAMVQQLDQSFDQITFTTFEHERAMTTDALYQLSDHPFKTKEENWQAYIKRTLLADDNDVVTFVSGSLAFVGKVREYIETMVLPSSK